MTWKRITVEYIVYPPNFDFEWGGQKFKFKRKLNAMKKALALGSKSIIRKFIEKKGRIQKFIITSFYEDEKAERIVR